MNKVILIGNLASDPELKTTTTGITVANFTVAVQRTFTSQNGEREADFIRCVAFKKTADNVGRYINKGSKVACDGRMQTRSYDAQDGSKRYVTEIICDSVQFLDSKGNDQNQNTMQNQYKQSQQQHQQQNQGNNHDINPNDLPF